MIQTPTNLDFLIQFVRLRVGDVDSSAYRYVDTWIRTALVAAVDKLTNWWQHKYLLDVNYNIYRNPEYTNFIYDEASFGVIEPGDK
ncbi:MAG: hypothetical protein ACUVRK_12340, partial [Spirochaetota bacterium]